MEVVKDKPGGREELDDDQTSRRSMLDGKNKNKIWEPFDCISYRNISEQGHA